MAFFNNFAQIKGDENDENQPPAGNQTSTKSGANFAAGAEAHLSGFTNVHKQVQAAIRANQASDGCPLQTVFDKLGGVDKTQIRNAIEFLSNEGHIYSTVDDDHFMTTD